MSDYAQKKSKTKAPSLKHWDKHEWSFYGTVTNITGAFSLEDVGSVRRLNRNVGRHNFVDEYLSDIAGIFQLTTGQVAILKMLMTTSEGVGTFDYNEAARARWFEATGITSNTINLYFRGLVSAKGLIKKIGAGRYKLNSELLFHEQEIKKADFLGVHLTYTFTDKVKPTVKDLPLITEEFINKAIEVRNWQLKQKGNLPTETPEDGN